MMSRNLNKWLDDFKRELQSRTRDDKLNGKTGTNRQAQRKSRAQGKAQRYGGLQEQKNTLYRWRGDRSWSESGGLVDE